MLNAAISNHSFLVLFFETQKQFKYTKSHINIWALHVSVNKTREFNNPDYTLVFLDK